MSRDVQPLLKNTLLAFGLCGLNPLKTNLFTPIQKAVTLLSIAAIFVIGFLEIPLNWKGIETLSNIELTPTMFMVTNKCLFLIINQSKIRLIVVSLEEFWSLDKFGDEFRAEVIKYHELGYKVVKSYVLVCLLCTSALCMVPFVVGNNKLIFPGYDFCNNSCFEVQQVWQSFALSFQMLPVAVGFDSLFISFICYGFVGIEMVKRAFQDLLLASTNNDDHDSARANLKELVDQHNFALKFIKDLNTIYSPILLVQFWSSLGGFIFLLYFLTINGIPAPEEMLRYGQLYVVLMFQLALYAVGGTIINEQTFNVGFEAYSVDWHLEGQGVLRKDLSFIILRSQKAEKITIGNMSILNMATYLDTVRTSISICALLKSISSNN